MLKILRMNINQSGEELEQQNLNFVKDFSFKYRNLSALEEEIHYKFKNIELLQKALRHPSIVRGNSKAKNSAQSYEKLEFLGDKVLNCVVAEALFKLFVNDSEGELSIKLNNLVSGKVINEIANQIYLIKFIQMSSAVKKIALSYSKNMLEDCMEAILGAVYVDGGFFAAQKSIIYLWKKKIQSVTYIVKDSKTQLQEILQKNGMPLPKYHILKNEGSDHEPIFHVEVEISSEYPRFQSVGRSLRIAQTEAANQAIDYLRDKFI